MRLTDLWDSTSVGTLVASGLVGEMCDEDGLRWWKKEVASVL